MAEDDLQKDLQRRVGEVRSDPSPDLVGLLVTVATSAGADDRAWALTRLAAALRKQGKPEEALRLLDAADSLQPSDWPRRALFTCAVSVHSDRGDYETAITVGEEQLAFSGDLKLYRAMARAYHSLFQKTEDPEHEERWRRFAALIKHEESLAQSIA